MRVEDTGVRQTLTVQPRSVVRAHCFQVQTFISRTKYKLCPWFDVTVCREDPMYWTAGLWVRPGCSRSVGQARWVRRGVSAKENNVQQAISCSSVWVGQAVWVRPGGSVDVQQAISCSSLQTRKFHARRSVVLYFKSSPDWLATFMNIDELLHITPR